MRNNYKTYYTLGILRSIQRNGLLYALKRLRYRFVDRLFISLFAQKTFIIENEHYTYFRASYNTTFINERAVEIPYFYQLCSLYNFNCIEIGNVLSHYFEPRWTIVDKYEKSKSVISADAASFKPDNKVPLVIAISTFEHIGYDEEDVNPNKIFAVIKNIMQNWLLPKGKLVISVPLGWNLKLDDYIERNALNYSKRVLLERTSLLNQWETISNPSKEWFDDKYKMIAKKIALLTFVNG